MHERSRRLSEVAAVSLTALAAAMGAETAGAAPNENSQRERGNAESSKAEPAFFKEDSPAFGKAEPAFLKEDSPAFSKVAPPAPFKKYIEPTTP
jgi:hypothetical protein